MRDEVIKRIENIGYSVFPKDYPLIEMEIERVQCYICQSIGLDYVPKVLKGILIDRAAGGFLFIKKRIDSDFSIAACDNGALKELKEGDVSVVYDTSTCQSKGSYEDLLIQRLMTCGNDEIIAHRAIVW